MDKTAIKSFAIESRRKLINDVKYQARLLGISSDEIKEPISKAEGMETYDFGAGTYTIYDADIEKRKNLVKEIKNKGFENVIEEVAYTWFNRIIAIRFMEVNDYLPTRIRVLSSEIDGKTEPDMISESEELDFDFNSDDIELISKLKDENKSDELFQFLFIKQCNKLNEILPGLFGKTDDYMELLLNISFTDEMGVVRCLINDISEDDFSNQVEIIGWLYQYYNLEIKDNTDQNYKNVPKESIPAVTQLFTPDWIVKYMVENSVGKLWIMGHGKSDLNSKWKYYVDDAEQNENTELKVNDLRKKLNRISPEEIKIIDPCMGSGHILVYIFDILMEIYISEGYTKNNAAECILKNNLYGLDIDDRAYQLAYFSVMMKARSYSRKIFSKNIFPHVMSIQETNGFNDYFFNILTSEFPEFNNAVSDIFNKFRNAKEYGSLINVNNDYAEFKSKLDDFINSNHNNLSYLSYKKEFDSLKNILLQSQLLSQKYDVVITNPPYLTISQMDSNLKTYVEDNFPDSKYDLCTAFIEKCEDLTKDMGFTAMITQQGFMFLGSYEKLRNKFLNNVLINMIHLGPHAFEEINGEVVKVVSFIKCRTMFDSYTSKFCRLIDYKKEHLKKEGFFDMGNWIISSYDKFKDIPRYCMAYWANEDIINTFNKGRLLGDLCDLKAGMVTGNNSKFLRLWYEVDINKSSISSQNFKWVPYGKGGHYRKWWGNQFYLLDWENEGAEMKKLKSFRPGDSNFYFKEALSCSMVSSDMNVRFYPSGFLFDTAGASLFMDDEYKNYVMGFLNSKISQSILECVAPPLSYTVGQVALLPLIFDKNYENKINSLVIENINIAKKDWDNYETSWNFRSHPFMKFEGNLENRFNCWSEYKENQFNKLKDNEEELNRIFSLIYDVNIDCSVSDENISITKADYTKDIKSFISYGVGCMFGRYSLDSDGLIFAGGNFDINNYSKFTPDDDNIIPVLDDEYFNDDIVGKFIEFVKICFGENTLEENLNFIGNALDSSNKSSRQKIRNYFLKEFFSDHVKNYSQPRNACGIYWMFDSGKQNAFKCLIYMHRYEPGLLARVRTDYLHKAQKAIDESLSYCETILTNSTDKNELKQARRNKDKFIKQLSEIKEYDEILAHMAHKQIEIDLDDGVKVNYSKFQNVDISTRSKKNKMLLKKLK